MADLFINGADAWVQYGVKMGEGFIDALETPPDLKERIVNTSRLYHGDRYVDQVNDAGQAIAPKVASRQLTLEFIIAGSGNTLSEQRTNFRTKKRLFLNLLQGVGEIMLKVPSISNNVYFLRCVAKSNSYSGNMARTLCKLSVKFVEENPTRRTEELHI